MKHNTLEVWRATVGAHQSWLWYVFQVHQITVTLWGSVGTPQVTMICSCVRVAPFYNREKEKRKNTKLCSVMSQKSVVRHLRGPIVSHLKAGCDMKVFMIFFGKKLTTFHNHFERRHNGRTDSPSIFCLVDISHKYSKTHSFRRLLIYTYYISAMRYAGQHQTRQNGCDMIANATRHTHFNDLISPNQTCHHDDAATTTTTTMRLFDSIYLEYWQIHIHVAKYSRTRRQERSSSKGCDMTLKYSKPQSFSELRPPATNRDTRYGDGCIIVRGIYFVCYDDDPRNMYFSSKLAVIEIHTPLKQPILMVTHISLMRLSNALFVHPTTNTHKPTKHKS